MAPRPVQFTEEDARAVSQEVTAAILEEARVGAQEAVGEGARQVLREEVRRVVEEHLAAAAQSLRGGGAEVSGLPMPVPKSQNVTPLVLALEALGLYVGKDRPALGAAIMLVPLSIEIVKRKGERSLPMMPPRTRTRR